MDDNGLHMVDIGALLLMMAKHVEHINAIMIV